MSTAAPTMPWVGRHRSLAIGIAWALLACYSLPLLLGIWGLIDSDMMKEDSWAVSWFAAFLRNGDSTLREFHGLMLPILTSISVVTFSRAAGRPLLGLAIFVLVVFACAVAVAVTLDIPSVAERVIGVEGGFDLDLARQLLGRMRETCLSYLMLLLGVSLVNSNQASAPPQSGNPGHAP